MSSSILITSASFQDTPGRHHQRVKELGWQVSTLRGPCSEQELLNVMGDFDGIICGDDEYTRFVLEAALPRLRVLSKYGIGLDSIDLVAAEELGIPVTNCAGANQITVAEHFFGLLLAVMRNIPRETSLVSKGEWQRITGHELYGKQLGLLGVGRTGREIAGRALAFGMRVLAFDPVRDEQLAQLDRFEYVDSSSEVIATAEILGLSMNLTPENSGFLNRERIARLPRGAVVINTARGKLIDTAAVLEALDNGHLACYAADVLEEEPPPPNHPLIGRENVLITPHIGSRTFESVERQGLQAIENALRHLTNEG